MMRALVVSLLIVVPSALGGCLSDDSEEFSWPDVIISDCNILEEYDLECIEYLNGLLNPILSIEHPNLPELWIIDLNGFIISWSTDSNFDANNPGTTVADLGSLIGRCHMEQGLLGFAFDYDFENSNKVLLSYIESGPCDGPNQSNLILAYATIDAQGKMDSESITTLMEIEQPYRNHNGGHIVSIGEGEYLWGIGDGGSANDPEGNGQDDSTKLGTILLFSFEGDQISPSSSISSPGEDPYILHYGLRNPWRFDVDTENRLWISDVGQNCWEEVNLVPMFESTNFGWAEMEGPQPFEAGGGCESNNSISSPELVHAYSHNNGNCSITGGFWMDWGPESLLESYIYGDFCSGSMWSISDTNGVWENNYLGSVGKMIVGFGKGHSDQLIIFGWDGSIIELREKNSEL